MSCKVSPASEFCSDRVKTGKKKKYSLLKTDSIQLSQIACCKLVKKDHLQNQVFKTGCAWVAIMSFDKFVSLEITQIC